MYKKKYKNDIQFDQNGSIISQFLLDVMTKNSGKQCKKCLMFKENNTNKPNIYLTAWPNRIDNIHMNV